MGIKILITKIQLIATDFSGVKSLPKIDSDKNNMNIYSLLLKY